MANGIVQSENLIISSQDNSALTEIIFRNSTDTPIIHNESSIVFYGKRITEAPQQLLLDMRLSELDRIAYQQSLIIAGEHHASLKITTSAIDTLTLLMCRSRQTIAIALDVLRACRWIVLHDDGLNQGRRQPKKWLLMAAPATIEEMTYIDQGYPQFLLDKAQLGAEKRIAQVTQQIIVSEQQELLLVADQFAHLLPPSYNQNIRRLITNLHVKKVNNSSTSSSYLNINTTTTNVQARAQEIVHATAMPPSASTNLDWKGLPTNYQRIILSILAGNQSKLSAEIKQDICKIVINRCLNTDLPAIDNLPAFVKSLIEKSKRGELYRPWEQQRATPQVLDKEKIIANKHRITEQEQHSKLMWEHSMRSKGAFQDNEGNWLYPKDIFTAAPYAAIDDGQGNWLIKRKGK